MNLNLWLFSLVFMRIVYCKSVPIYCEKVCEPEMVLPLACTCKWGGSCTFFQDGNEDMSWPDFRRALLNAHNKYRNQFALASTDLEKSHGFYGVSDMLALSYDYELEYAARCHTKRCVIDKHCVMTEKYSHGGQNIFTLDKVSRDPQVIATHALLFWYDIDRVGNSEATSKEYTSNGKNFLQIVWASTESIGCWASKGIIRRYVNVAKTIETIPIPTKRMMVTCAYGPGIIVNGTVFKPGTAASRCPPGLTKNLRYKGLCGNDVMPEKPADLRNLVDESEDRKYEESPSSSGSKCLTFNLVSIMTLTLWRFFDMN